MRFRTPPVVWAMLVATAVNVVIFDLLVLRADDPGLPEVLLAGGVGIAAALAILYAFDRFGRR